MKFAKIRNVKSPVRGTGKAAGIDFSFLTLAVIKALS